MILVRSIPFAIILVLLELHLEPSQTSTIECFGKIANGIMPLTVSAETCILDVWLGSEHACVITP